MFSRTGFIPTLPLFAALARIALGLGTAATTEVWAEEPAPGRADVASVRESVAAEKAGPGGGNGSVQFRDGSMFGGDAPSFFWNRTTKRLGIGTQSPAQKLDIRDPVTPAMSIGDGGASGTLELAVATADGFFSNVATRGDAVIRIPGGHGQDLILAVRNGNNGALRFTTGTTSTEAERMTITSTGNVGIGTTAPGEQLEITGNLRLPMSTENVGVIKVGEKRFIHNAGDKNTFIGLDAGNFSMTGEGNTGNGFQALAANTTGTCNTAIGGETLQANRKGDNNTAVGHLALTKNVDGTDNTASGVLALAENTIGNRNTASGDNALTSNTVGDDNTADGTFALGQNTSGFWNTATGASALRTNTEGVGNTASGFHALYFNNGNDNAALGWNALSNNTIGYYNTACGAGTFGGNTTGTYNTGIGAQADVSRGDLHNATAIGALAVVDASNKIRLGNDAVTVIEGRVPYTWGSDLHHKENFRPVDGEEVLTKIRGLNLRSWNYIGDDPRQFRHYGPVAQEFFAAFGHDEVGTSGTPTTINSGDEAGILMMAVQALEKRTEEVETLKAQVAELREIVRALAAQLK